jgi:hypothetical protein
LQRFFPQPVGLMPEPLLADDEDSEKQQQQSSGQADHTGNPVHR